MLALVGVTCALVALGCGGVVGVVLVVGACVTAGAVGFGLLLVLVLGAGVVVGLVVLLVGVGGIAVDAGLVLLLLIPASVLRKVCICSSIRFSSDVCASCTLVRSRLLSCVTCIMILDSAMDKSSIVTPLVVDRVLLPDGEDVVSSLRSCVAAVAVASGVGSVPAEVDLGTPCIVPRTALPPLPLPPLPGVPRPSLRLRLSMVRRLLVLRPDRMVEIESDSKSMAGAITGEISSDPIP